LEKNVKRCTFRAIGKEQGGTQDALFDTCSHLQRIILPGIFQAKPFFK
jgi:hypothetical protein